MTHKHPIQNATATMRKPRSNPAKKNELKALREELDSLSGVRAANARMEAHLDAARKAGVSGQAQVIGKVDADGNVAYKLQGLRIAGVKQKAESSQNAKQVFTVVNAQNRQLEAMTAYLWAVRNGEHEAVLSSLAPMAQGHEVVQAVMDQTAFTDKKGVKKASFIQQVSDAMVLTIWKK